MVLSSNSAIVTGAYRNGGRVGVCMFNLMSMASISAYIAGWSAEIDVYGLVFIGRNMSCKE
jgi:hypothetical protein